ncbi:putative nucleic acid-binding protein [Polaromonas sp. CG_9.5]|uniref:PIN domain-containing protein n=1 Tax=Polaromonas sp. CG_9.5 TaxID=3071705 RepID=UPI002DF90F03|nr:putative nucleic acid-binding protein [Polaromonas sp. CG_9.5]
MAGSSRFTAILDANVLYPQLIRDTLLSLAVGSLYHARWSRTIHDEWTSNLAKDRPELAARLPAVVELMNASVPDCLVIHYEKLIPSIELPDLDDRHVVAAAIVGHADAIVTFNTKDFPPTVLQPYGIEVQHPDEFLMNQLQLQKIPALSAIKKMRARWTNPERPALALIAAFEKRGLPLRADLLREAVDLI